MKWLGEVVGAVVVGLLLAAIVVLGSGCDDDFVVYDTGFAPAVLTVAVGDDGDAIISAHPSFTLSGGYSTATLWREDAQETHTVSINDAVIISDALCPGTYTYFLQDDNTGDILSAVAVRVGEDVPPACVNPEKKVAICHGGHTIMVNEHAVHAHLAHGDTEGACEDLPPAPPPSIPCVDTGWEILEIDADQGDRWVPLPSVWSGWRKL